MPVNASTQIKVCGISRIEDAKIAIELGAKYIGLIFAAESPRKVSLESARAITNEMKGQALFVGVFKDNAPEAIEKTMESIPLDLVQLHGSESPEFCKAMKLPVIKTIEIDLEQTWPDRCREELRNYRNHVRYFLFDKPKQLNDETWLLKSVEFLSEIADESPDYFFAGGLNPNNVKDVLSIISPYAVDVASGIENAPGIKDPDKMKSFFMAVSSSKEFVRGKN